MSFENKVVVVTGGSSGIGAATALLFAKEGANVVIVGRNVSKLKVIAAQCEESGKKPLTVIADVTKEEQAVSIIDQTIDKFGKIDVLVNNAGIIRLGNVLDGTILNTFDELMNTNLRAIIHLTTLATPHLIKTKGNIVNISSTAGSKLSKKPIFLGYSISKTALNVFSQGTAIELAPFGVRVNTISPGPVHTDIIENSNIPAEAFKDIDYKTALNRMSNPEEIANLIMYLAGSNAVAITGSNYVSDNGLLLLN